VQIHPNDLAIWHEIEETVEEGLRLRKDPVGVARSVLNLRANMTAFNNEVFDTFLWLDSETDMFPRAAERVAWNPDALKTLDVRLEEFLSNAAPLFWDECVLFLAKLKNARQRHDKWGQTPLI
jgi:hypothetical protein